MYAGCPRNKSGECVYVYIYIRNGYVYEMIECPFGGDNIFVPKN